MEGRVEVVTSIKLVFVTRKLQIDGRPEGRRGGRMGAGEGQGK